MPDYSAFAEAERRGWADADRVSAYAALFAPVSDQIVPALVAASGAGPGRRVLDVCCGHGNATEALAATGAEVTGLDFSAAFLEIARQRVPAAAFVEGDVQAMPFEDGAFDAVTCNVGLGHVPDPDAAVAEIARVLAPGGRAVLSAWAEAARSPAFQVFFGALKAHAEDLSLAPDAPDFHLFAREAEVTALLRGAGLGDVRVRTVDVAFDLARADDFAEVFRSATVRAAMVITAQPPAAQAAIWSAMTEEVAAAYGDGAGRYRVPFPAVLTTAAKP